VGFHYDEELVSRIMFEPLGIGGDIGGKYLALVIGIIAVVLFIFHTNRTLVHNDHSKSKRPPRNRDSKPKGSSARFKSADNPLTATTTTTTAGTKAQGD